MRVMIRAIVGAKLIDGTGSPPVSDSVIVWDNSRVSSVGRSSEVEVPKEAAVIDGSGLTVIPGLMDLHVHIASPYYPPYADFRIGMTRTHQTLAALYAAKHAQDLIKAGFTTVRDLGNPPYTFNRVALSLRRAIELGLTLGPRLIVAGTMSTTAGHFDMSTPNWIQGEEYTVDGPWEARKRVRELVRLGVDWIKVAGSGGMAGELEEVWWTNFTEEEFSAITEEAHGFGKKVAVHVYGSTQVKKAISCGADTIEHGFPLDEETITLIVEKGIYLIPTLHVFSEREMSAIRGSVHEHMMRKIEQAVEVCSASFRRAVRAGVKIACGTDITILSPPAIQHGENAFELELLVKHGMSELDAVKTATANSADALGLSDQLGTIEKGKFADMLLVQGNLLSDIRILQEKENIRKVIKAGSICVDREE